MSDPSGLALGLDIGGTKILAAVVDQAGEVHWQGRRPWRAASTEELIGELAGAVHGAQQGSGLRFQRVGLGVAAYVDFAAQQARFAPHLPLREVALAHSLAQRLDDLLERPVVMDNDATTATLAEARWGAACEETDAVVITLGTGLGSGLVLDGELRRGRSGMAGEWGHTCVELGGRECPCGLAGCWERYCSGSALVWHARRRAGAAASYRDGEAVASAAATGDPAAKAAFEDLGYWLARGLGSVVAALDPGCVVISGGLSSIGERFVPRAAQLLPQFVTGAAHRELPSVRLGRYGPSAGAVGAAALVLD